MRVLLNFLKQYIYEVNKWVMAAACLMAALLIFINYHFAIDNTISDYPGFTEKFLFRWLLFFIAFSFPYLITSVIKKNIPFRNFYFLLLLILAPAIFSFKMALTLAFHYSDDYQWNTYWYYIVYWPLLVAILFVQLFFIWKLFHADQPFYGLKIKGINWKPYLVMLLIMIPLIVAASTQNDFLEKYPKMKMISGMDGLVDFNIWYKILFEISYGTDFISVELFFRGFLVLGFIKWAGKDAILPMALFYCTIHFGKPLGECISSFFGGILLGVVVYHTRSILGGLIVHLGIAWLMELGGHAGNQLFK